MTAHVIHQTNPLQMADIRSWVHYEVDEPVTVRGFLDGVGIAEFQRPTICSFNGEWLLRDEWVTQEIQPDDIVIFHTLPNGGGGGGGKNPLAIVLSIGIMIAAPMLGAALGGALGITSAIGIRILTGAISMVMNALVSSLLPEPEPASSSASGSRSALPAAEPTYHARVQGNVARLGEPVPDCYGRCLYWPDYIAYPYGEYDANEHYVYMHLCMGLGMYQLEKILIDDTPIASFEEATWWKLDPGDPWPTGAGEPHIITAREVSGQTLKAPNESGDWVGPFVLNPGGADAQVNRIDIDVVCPNGLYYVEDNGDLSSKTVLWDIQAREIDDTGDPIGDWIQISSKSITAATTTPQRRTYSFAVAAGRYEVRLKRTNDKSIGNRFGHDLVWAGLKGRLVAKGDYSDVTRLVVKVKATETNQMVGRVNVIYQRLLPTWSAVGGWTAPVATSNPAWAIANVFRSEQGANVADDRLVLEDWERLAQVWDTRGDEFNMAFKGQMTVWAAAQKIARVGRARPIQQLGLVYLFRDEPRTVPVQIFTPNNIVRGSFSMDFIMPSEDTADALEISWTNAETWRDERIRLALPDSNQERVAKVRLDGVTNRDQVIREGGYMARDNRYRRRLVGFSTELDGLACRYGNPVALVHDLPEWGQWGEAVWWAEETLTMTLSEPLVWTDGEQHYVGLSRRDGTLSGPYAVSPGVTDYDVVLDALPDFAPYTGGDEERTRVAFGPGDNWSQTVLVAGVKPRGDLVEVMAFVDHELVHDDTHYVEF